MTGTITELKDKAEKEYKSLKEGEKTLSDLDKGFLLCLKWLRSELQGLQPDYFCLKWDEVMRDNTTKHIYQFHGKDESYVNRFIEKNKENPSKLNLKKIRLMELQGD